MKNPDLGKLTYAGLEYGFLDDYCEMQWEKEYGKCW